MLIFSAEQHCWPAPGRWTSTRPRSSWRRVPNGSSCSTTSTGPGAVELLSLVGSRLVGRPVAVLATTSTQLGLTPEVRLAGLTEGELAVVLGGLPEGAGQALWLASGGLPGPARRLAVQLAGL